VIRFIDEHQDRRSGSLRWGIEPIAKTLGIAPSTYHAAKKRPPSARKLRDANPGLRLAGVNCPPHGFERDAAARERVAVALRNARPDIVYVALGFPKQEMLIRSLRGEMPSVWFLGVGISLSFVAGRVRRAPTWMRKAGLEWLHRLIQEPRRLSRRYLIDGLPFAVRLFVHALRSRLRPASR